MDGVVFTSSLFLHALAMHWEPSGHPTNSRAPRAHMYLLETILLQGVRNKRFDTNVHTHIHNPTVD